jgi:hypothetical protein
VRRGDCSFSEFHVKWLGRDSDSWVPECDIDPELVVAYRAQHRSHALPSSSPSMTRAAAVAAAAAAGSSTLSSSSATKSSSSGTFSGGCGEAFKTAASSLPAREQVSFCSQLTPVALARPSQHNDCFTSPVLNGSLLAAGAGAIVMSSGGTSTMVASSLFCSPVAVADTPVNLNSASSSSSSSSSSQSQPQLSTSSITSTQHPSSHLTPPGSQKSSLSVEFPPSFPYRLSQQEPLPSAPPALQHLHNAMDIGDYCVGMLPSLCNSKLMQLPQHAAPPSLPSCIPTVASVLVPATPLSQHNECAQLAADTVADSGVAVDGSARKRRRVVASRNLGGCSM